MGINCDTLCYMVHGACTCMQRRSISMPIKCRFFFNINFTEMYIEVAAVHIIKMVLLPRTYCDCSGGWSVFVDLYNELPHPAEGDPERKK